MSSANKLRLFVSLSFALVGLVAAPMAVAEGGTGDPGMLNSGSEQKKTAENKTTVNNTEHQNRGNTNKVENENEGGDKNHDDSSLRGRAQQLLNDRRGGRIKHTDAERKKACTEHKDKINNRISNLNAKAQKHLNAFNQLFEKVKAYQAKNNLNVSNYDELVATVTAKQALATATVAALNAANPIDCTATDPASNVAVDKTAADDARAALQAYRTALKDLINAMLAAKQSATTNDSTSGGSQ